MDNVTPLLCQLFAMVIFARDHRHGRSFQGPECAGGGRCWGCWESSRFDHCRVPAQREGAAGAGRVSGRGKPPPCVSNWRQERIKSAAFRQHAAARLDAHDQHLGLDTRAIGPTLTGGAAMGELGPGSAAADPALASAPNLTDSRWYYGRQGKTIGPVNASEIADLIRLQIVTRDTLLWSEDMADWLPAGDVAAFTGHFG